MRGLKFAGVILTIGLITAGAGYAAPKPAKDKTQQGLYINYQTTERVRTADDYREIYQTAGLSVAEADFSYDDRILGAITPVVQETHYRRAMVEITPAQKRALARALMDAGLAQLRSDKGAYNPDCDIWLQVFIHGHDYDLTFNRPLTGDPRRAAVVKVWLDFVHQLGIDTPSAEAKHVSEGDTIPAQSVTIAELIAHPAAYDGKRVAVAGYFHGEFEGENFCITPTDVYRSSETTHLYAACLWHGEPSTFAAPSALAGHNNDWEHVEGVFFKGPNGHMGMWPGGIERLTRTETIAAPK